MISSKLKCLLLLKCSEINDESTFKLQEELSLPSPTWQVARNTVVPMEKFKLELLNGRSDMRRVQLLDAAVHSAAQQSRPKAAVLWHRSMQATDVLALVTTASESVLIVELAQPSENKHGPAHMPDHRQYNKAWIPLDLPSTPPLTHSRTLSPWKNIFK